MAGRFGLHFLRGRARINQILRNAAIHQQHFLPWKSFAIPWGTHLQRMVHVIPQSDILAENFLAHALVQARTLIENRRSRKIVENRPDKIERRGRLQNCRVVARLQFARLARASRLFARTFE